MVKRSLLKRIIGLAYLALAFTLLGVLPAAEAHADAASAVAAHAEAPGDAGCPTAHNHWDCNICRALRLMARREIGSEYEVAVAGPAATFVEREHGRGLQSDSSPSRSRAPPTR